MLESGDVWSWEVALRELMGATQGKSLVGQVEWVSQEAVARGLSPPRSCYGLVSARKQYAAASCVAVHIFAAFHASRA